MYGHHNDNNRRSTEAQLPHGTATTTITAIPVTTTDRQTTTPRNDDDGLETSRLQVHFFSIFNIYFTNDRNGGSSRGTDSDDTPSPQPTHWHPTARHVVWPRCGVFFYLFLLLTYIYLGLSTTVVLPRAKGYFLVYLFY